MRDAMRKPPVLSAAGGERRPGASVAALVLSVLVHAALFSAFRTATGGGAHAHAQPPNEPADLWVGTTAALPGAGDVHEVEVEVTEAAPAKAAPAIVTPAPAAPADPAVPAEPDPSPPAPRPEPAAPRATAAPQPQPPKEATPKAKPEAVKPAEVKAKPEVAKPEDDPYAEAPRSAEAVSEREKRRSKVRAQEKAQGTTQENEPAPAKVSSANAGQPAGRDGGEAHSGGDRGQFGAEGVNGTRSLGRAFTRAIPPACQTDPVWRALPAGIAGTARVVVEIDAAGRVSGWKAEGAKPAPHFEGLMKRTLAMLGAGVFAVQGGEVSAGSQTLELGAEVIETGEAAAPDALAWKFQEGRGEASFVPMAGKRVEVRLRVIRAAVSGARPPG